MRCIICDYTKDVPSLFHSGLHDTCEEARTLIPQPDGSFICTWCDDASTGLWDPDLDEEEDDDPVE